MIRVAHVSELPPGKGKVVELANRRVTVYNVDGKLVATATRPALPPREPDTRATDRPSHAFEVFAQDSPAKLRDDDVTCRVRVEHDEIWLDD
jgi:hypothetical protein